LRAARIPHAHGQFFDAVDIGDVTEPASHRRRRFSELIASEQQKHPSCSLGLAGHKPFNRL
jgi:hypothetical protein